MTILTKLPDSAKDNFVVFFCNKYNYIYESPNDRYNVV
jgi:hypothetical protein